MEPLLVSHVSDVAVDFILTHLSSAHQDAWENANVLHCDISVSNILIVEVGPDTPRSGDLDVKDRYAPSPEDVDSDDPDIKNVRGVLIDWDLCKFREDLGAGATQTHRSVSCQLIEPTSAIDF